MPNFTQALYEARELAMERMQTEADELQAEGIVGARIIERSHGWGSHVIEFFAIGTAVVLDQRRARDRQAGAGPAAPGLSLPRWPDVEINRRSTRTSGRRSTFDQYHERVRDGEPEAKVYEVVRVVTVLNALIGFRARGIHS